MLCTCGARADIAEASSTWEIEDDKEGNDVGVVLSHINFREIADCNDLATNKSRIQVVRYEQIFEATLFSRLDEELKQYGFKYGWRSNTSMGFGHWNYDFAKCLKENGIDISGRLSGCVAEAWKYLIATRYPDCVLLRAYMNAHTFGVEGSPHTDSIRGCDKTLVVYMNPTWRREWGGETMLYDGYRILHAELPRRNAAIEFAGNTWHVARGCTRICPELRVTLVFKLAPKGVDPFRDTVQHFLLYIGTENVKHVNGPLIGHLLRVYDWLRIAAGDDELCAVGACHSIFGTNHFRNKVLDDVSDYPKVVAAVGQGAADLAVLFSRIARPGELERGLAVPEQLERGLAVPSVTSATAGEGGHSLRTNDNQMVNLTARQFERLCLVECANLLDQQGLERFPNLAAFWKKRLQERCK